jgi:hypothetical protein
MRLLPFTHEDEGDFVGEKRARKDFLPDDEVAHERYHQPDKRIANGANGLLYLLLVSGRCNELNAAEDQENKAQEQAEYQQHRDDECD